MQQPEAKASQGGEEAQAQGRGGPRGGAVAAVLLAAGGVVGQAQLVVGLVEGLQTGLFGRAAAKVGENPHLAWGWEWAMVSAGGAPGMLVPLPHPMHPLTLLSSQFCPSFPFFSPLSLSQTLPFTQAPSCHLPAGVP